MYIQETRNSKCDSEDIDEEALDDNEAGYKETFGDNKLSAVPGERRYLKCSKLCGDEVNSIEISCQVFITTSEFICFTN